MATEVVGRVLLRGVRLSFADIYRPSKDKVNKKTGEVMKGRFSANFLNYRDSPNYKANMAAIKKGGQEARIKKWGENPKKWPKLKPEKICTRDGDLEDWEGFEGADYLSANAPANRPPQVIQNRKHKVKAEDGTMKLVWAPAEEGAKFSPYSGCIVNAVVSIWAQDDEDYGKRLNASLEIVQYAAEGEAFGAAAPDADEIMGDDLMADESDLGDEDEDDDDDDSSLI